MTLGMKYGVPRRHFFSPQNLSAVIFLFHWLWSFFFVAQTFLKCVPIRSHFTTEDPGNNNHPLPLPGQPIVRCVSKKCGWLLSREVATPQLFRDLSSLRCPVNQAVVSNLKGKTNSLSRHTESCYVSTKLVDSKAINLFLQGSLSLSLCQWHILESTWRMKNRYILFWKPSNFVVA